MPNTIPSPEMGMPVPVVSVDPGPDWANNIDASLSIVDQHDHSPGKGVQITPAGININADLPFNGNNATGLRSTRFSVQSSQETLPADLNQLYDLNGDLWFIDGSGNQVRITQGGAIVGPAGSITGLPSGTASASYAAGQFTWRAATNTPAAMSVGPLIIGAQIVNPFTTTLQTSASQAANIVLTLPLAAPTGNQVLQTDSGGNMSWGFGQMPIGSVIATFPNLTGAYTTAATTVADSYGFVLCQGQTIADASSPMNGQVVPNINNDVFLLGHSSAGLTGGSTTQSLSVSNLPSHTHTFTSTTSVASSIHTHIMDHIHQWGQGDGGGDFYTLNPKSSSFVSKTSITTGDFKLFGVITPPGGAGTAAPSYFAIASIDSCCTTGVLYPPTGTDGAGAATADPGGGSNLTTVSGTTDATGSGTSFSIVPPFITAVYLMRVK